MLRTATASYLLLVLAGLHQSISLAQPGKVHVLPAEVTPGSQVTIRYDGTWLPSNKKPRTQHRQRRP